MFGRRQALSISQGVPEAAPRYAQELMFVMMWLRLAVLPRAPRVDDERKRGITRVMVTKTHSWLWKAREGVARCTGVEEYPEGAGSWDGASL